VRGKRDCGSEQGGDEPLPLGQLCRCGVGQERSHRDAHERVHCVPQEIEERDFVAYEFDKEKRAAGRNHEPAFD